MRSALRRVSHFPEKVLGDFFFVKRVDLMAKADIGRRIGPVTRTGRPAAPARRRSWVWARRGSAGREAVYALLSVLFCSILVYLLWEAACLAQVLPQIVLPTPLQVLQTLRTELATGDLQANMIVTLKESLGGFLLAAVIAGACGYLIAHARPLELLVAPFVAASQGVPAVAIAPIVILLLGSGLWPKVVICAAVVLFPLLVTTVTGLRGIGQDYRDVAHVFGASRLQMLRYVEIPLAAPVLLSGLKLGLTLSITGAVVAEFVAADAGLGFMLNTAINTFEVSTRYVALLTLAVLSASMFGAITLLERIVQQWQEE
ncbi:MAG: ABC transporter permease [Chloroflexi bacterium]|nr:MAG: ABC transporter permease [Chloroflexota bacterium]